MTRAACALLLLALGPAGCGPDGRMTYAEETVRLSSTALARAQSSGGDRADLATPIADVEARLAEVERAMEVWRDQGGPLAYRTRAPCLRAALVSLRAALIAASLDVPRELDQADALFEEVGGRCGPRTR